MVYFKEEQRFDQWWLYIIIVGNNLLVIGALSYVIYEQIFIQGSENSDVPNYILLLIWVATIIVTFIITWGLFIAKLETQVKNSAFHYRFKPFVWNWKKINFNELKSFEVKKNKQFGLRKKGYRYSFRTGKSMIVKGNYAIYLILKNGKKLLIGTQKPEKLQITMEGMEKKKLEKYAQ